MTHTGPIPESEGDLGEPERGEIPCRRCGKRERVICQAWDSHCGGYTDYKYTCESCGHVWWIDGPDS